MKLKTPVSAIDGVLQKKVSDIKESIFRMLCYVGETCRNRAVKLGNYKNSTYNLRSSVGYVVVEDGQIREVSSFGGGSANSGDGKKAGKDLALELAGQYGSGMVLIVVAGMSYAVYVAGKGYDVLDSAELEAKRLVPMMMEKLRF